MPLIRDPIDGALYDITPAHERNITANRHIGATDDWLHRYLQQQQGVGAITLVADAVEEAPREIRFAAPIRKRKKPEETVKTDLTFPVVPETDEAGNKRLYKSRYAILEKKYADLYAQVARLEKEGTDLYAEYQSVSGNNRQLRQEVQNLQALTADSAAVEKRMTQIIKEMKLEMPYMGPMPKLGDKLEAFLGAVLCRVRNVEEEADELAD